MAKNKTNIKVTAVYDGELDATDVFVGLIARQYAGKCHDKGTRNISKEYLAKKQETVYNNDEVQKSQKPSGLCG